MEELKNLLIELENEYDLRSTYMIQATHGMRWMHLNGDLTVPTKNPWENFVGQYVVQSVTCDLASTFEHEIEFKVENTASGLYFRRIFKSSSMADPIKFGAYNFNAFLNNYGETSDGDVFMIHEMGGSWSARDYAESRISNLSLKRTSSNTFEITKANYSLSKDVTKPDFNQTCVFKGMFQ